MSGCPLCREPASDRVTRDVDVRTCGACKCTWRQDARGPIILKEITTAPIRKRETWAASVEGEAAQIGRVRLSRTF